MKRLTIILGLIVLQIVGALTAGYSVVNMNMSGIVGEGVYFEYVSLEEAAAGGVAPQQVSLSGMPIEAAASTVFAKYDEILKEGQARIRYGDGEFVFYYAELEYVIDREALISEIEEKSEQAKRLNLLSSNWRNYTVRIIPDIKISDDAFKILLKQIKSHIERNPSNANIDIIEGVVTVTPDVSGVVFDIDKSYQSIKESFLRDPFGILYLSNRNGREIELSPARVPAELLSDMETIIAEASTPIMPDCDKELLQKAAESINKVFLRAVDNEGNDRRTELFSLNKYLINRNLQEDTVVEEFNQLASTLYIAILRAGIDNGSIYLYRQDRKAEYCDLGFNVSVLGNNRDFRFENTLNSDIIIFASVDEDENELVVRIAGKFDDENAYTHTVTSRIIETIEPQVIHIESDQLKAGDEEVQDRGVAGNVVAIFRDGTEIERVEFRGYPRTVMTGNNVFQ